MITSKTIETPLGPAIACATDEGICVFDFTDRRMMDDILKRAQKGLGMEVMEGEHPHFTPLEEQLAAYFAGTLKAFDLPLNIIGTPFQKSVWQELLQIPYGETRSYKKQSVALGNEKAIRAVAGANGENGLTIIVPCHRVIGSNGELTGYGGGLWRKEWLLKHEAKHSGKETQSSLF